MKTACTCTARPFTILAGAALFMPQMMTAGPGSAPAAIAGQKPHLAENYGKLPLAFEANHGQTDSAVRFLSRGNGYTLFLTESEAVLSLRTAPSGDKPAADSLLRMKLIGANARPAVTGEKELSGRSNYFIGNDPKKWRTNVPNYARVKYQGVYPGVDLVYYGNQGGQLEYDFLVAPGANPAAIRFSPGGVPKIDPNGDTDVVDADLSAAFIGANGPNCSGQSPRLCPWMFPGGAHLQAVSQSLRVPSAFWLTAACADSSLTGGAASADA
jgi:hypothetical protein